jgi:hypothetical protein
MLAAVSRNDSMLAGGISSGKWTGRGTVVVEPLARLTSSGLWIGLPCNSENQRNCLKFAHDYLSKPHVYTVVSSDGRGATVRSKATTLSECFDYSGTGTYSGAAIERSAIAASSTELFGDSDAVQPLDKEDALAVRTLLTELVPKKLDSTSDLRMFSVQLEGHELYIVQRSFSDAPEGERRKLVFGIGVVEPHRFHLLHWKQNSEDENERVLGTIRLRNGHDFLITVVNDPESHFFRVYGLRGGQVTIVYSGGGASC